MASLLSAASVEAQMLACIFLLSSQQPAMYAPGGGGSRAASGLSAAAAAVLAQTGCCCRPAATGRAVQRAGWTPKGFGPSRLHILSFFRWYLSVSDPTGGPNGGLQQHG
eukprot:GHUV01047464.1.p3 GENE.GHUV01047464.1~~GHUV01047464.1.p3  ORF type:complete len:109 (+),score=30.21 GHUV01047464.1:1908-2234(+)